MINTLFSVRAARIGLALNCLVGCCFLAGCQKAQVWVAGGGFLMHGTESAESFGTLTLNAQKPSLDTQVLLLNYVKPSLLDLLGALFAGSAAPPSAQQLWVPPTTGGVQMYDVSNGSGSYTAKTVSTGGKIAIGLAQDGMHVYASHPFDSAVSIIDESKLTVTTTLTLTAGQQPSYIAKDKGLYVIIGGDLVKLSGGSNPVVWGSSPVDDGVSDLQAGQGYVVAPSIANDKIYVFNDDAGQENPHLWWTLNTQNGSPFRVAISKNSATAYVTLMTGTEGTAPGIVDVLDLAGRQVTAHVTVGACPSAIAVAQVGVFSSWHDNSVLVGNQCDGTLSRIDVSTIPSSPGDPPATVQTIPLPGAPNAIATN
jgi:hypothetical protein